MTTKPTLQKILKGILSIEDTSDKTYFRLKLVRTDK
jgi:hypothetical protein